MDPLFEPAIERLREAISTSTFPIPDPLPIDRWLAASLLQKAIRRGEADVAVQAAVTLLNSPMASLWRRLVIIAFEDLGAGSVDLIIQAVVVHQDREIRNSLGPELLVGVTLTRLMANAAKERSADYTICAAKAHPYLEAFRGHCGSRSLGDRLALVTDMNLTLPERELAAWYASGIEWGDEKRLGKGNLPGLMEAFDSLQIPRSLINATHVAAKATREPIVIMVPLIWHAIQQAGDGRVRHNPVPDSPFVNGVPVYGFDKHTRLGQQAIWRFARENRDVHDVLEQFVPELRHRDAVLMACYYADAAPISNQLAWSCSDRLEKMGTQNDLLKAGVPFDGGCQLVDVVCENLRHLNEIRSGLFEVSNLR